jgi:hypothetical protein
MSESKTQDEPTSPERALSELARQVTEMEAEAQDGLDGEAERRRLARSLGGEAPAKPERTPPSPAERERVPPPRPAPESQTEEPEPTGPETPEARKARIKRRAAELLDAAKALDAASKVLVKAETQTKQSIDEAVTASRKSLERSAHRLNAAREAALASKTVIQQASGEIRQAAAEVTVSLEHLQETIRQGQREAAKAANRRLDRLRGLVLITLVCAAVGVGGTILAVLALIYR